MKPLVSILIPCYNAAQYVSEAIESALAQTWENKEIIVVDDGSTDGSAAVIDQYIKHGVKVIHQPNRGQSAAANRAFGESQGTYVKFFDADDLIHHDLVAAQVQRLAGETRVVASSEWGRFYHDDIRTFRSNWQKVWRDMDAKDWLVEAWTDARPMMQCAIWLIPRPLLDKTGLWNEELSLTNDLEFFTRILCDATEVRFTPGVPVYYRSGISESLSKQRNRKAVVSGYKAVVLGTSHLLKNRNDVLASKACANILQDFIYTYYPEHGDLCEKASERVNQLGGSDLQPAGGVFFNALLAIVGWKAAKRLQKFAYRLGYERLALGRYLCSAPPPLPRKPSRIGQ